jgi:hypothetical protein
VIKVALVLLSVAALLVMSEQATAQEAVRRTEKDGVDQAEPTGPLGSGMIFVSKRPFEMLAGPSSSAVALYGFPAGRPFRLIGHESGFAHVQDLKSGATGWIDETAFEQSPHVPAPSAVSKPKPAPRNQTAATASAERKPKTHAPAASTPSEHKPASRTHKATTASAAPKPKATKRDAETPTPQTPQRRGIFGLGVLY